VTAKPEETIYRLAASGVMSADEIDGYLVGLPPEERSSGGELLLRALVRDSRLTKYQADCIRKGEVQGLVLGEYEILDEIGAGGMGKVFKARHRRMNRLVALKILPPKAVASEESVKRFHREIEAVARLEHANIVIAYDAGEASGVHYLVMQYVDGQDLAKVLRHEGPLPVAQAIDYIFQAAKGLEYAHAQGVIHRDLKPSNLFRDAHGTVKVLDLGLARLVEGSAGEVSEDALTASNQVMGTPEYMAPEQADDTHQADHRCDIYSLGCTLFCLLTGRAPYGGDKPTKKEVPAWKKVMAHRLQPIPSLCAARRDVPPELDAVFHKMMAKQPEERYQSITEVLVALEACRHPRRPPPRRAELPPTASPAAPATRPRSSATVEDIEPSVMEEIAPPTPPPADQSYRAFAETIRQQIKVDTKSHSKQPPRDRRNTAVYLWVGGIGGAIVVGLAIVMLIVMIVQGQKKPTAGPSEPEKTAKTAKTAKVEKWDPAAIPVNGLVKEEPFYEHKDLYDFLENTLRTSQGKYVLLLTYTEIAAVINSGRSGTWTIGAGKTKDDNAYEVSVKAGKWSWKKLSGLELMLVKRDSISRSVPVGGEMPAEPLVSLAKPQLRVVRNAKGEQTLVGTIYCTRNTSKWVEHLTLWIQCKADKKEVMIVSFDANELPRTGPIEVNYKPLLPANFEEGGRIYLEAFLCRPKAGLFRISNELPWSNGTSAEESGP
jgi:serine/threonine protein kinase